MHEAVRTIYVPTNGILIRVTIEYSGSIIQTYLFGKIITTSDYEMTGNNFAT